jgi:hypothetical protein
LAPTAINLAPSALPLVGTLFDLNPTILTAAALGSFGAAVAEVAVIPDDNTAFVAVQVCVCVRSVSGESLARIKTPGHLKSRREEWLLGYQQGCGAVGGKWDCLVCVAVLSLLK